MQAERSYLAGMSALGPDRNDAQPTVVDHPSARPDPFEPHPHSPPPSGGGRSAARIAIIAGAAVLVLAAAGIALASTVFSGDDEVAARNEYRTKVNTAMGDVMTANRALSNSLARLRSRRSRNAERAAARAQTATASARGAINALTVPPGSEQLAANARQTLSREAAYLSAVAGALDRPAGPGGRQAPTLAGNLVDALDVVSPTDADWSQTVSGADNLGAWTGRNLRAKRRADRRRKDDRNAPGGSSPGAAAPQPAPAAAGTDCGSGLRAGPNTTCGFAANVREAYNDAPGSSATVEVFSPATGRTYTMSCRPAGSGVTCSGGNDASVSFGG